MRGDNDADPFVVVLKYVISLTLWMNTAPPFHKHFKFDKIFVPDKLFFQNPYVLTFLFYFRCNTIL